MSQQFDVAAVAVPAGEFDRPTIQCLFQHHRRGQLPGGSPIPVTGEVVAQHDRLLLQCPGEHRVVIKRALDLIEALGKAGLVTHLVLSQLAQPLQAGTVVRLRKHHVKTDQRRLLAVQQLADQLPQLVTPPGPAANFGQTLLVNVDNDDALVHRPGHGGAKTGVIDDVVQALHDPDAQRATGMQQGEDQRDQGDGDALPVF